MTVRQRIEAMKPGQILLAWVVAVALGGLLRAVGHNLQTPLLGLPVDFWQGFFSVVAIFPAIAIVVVPTIFWMGRTTKPPSP